MESLARLFVALTDLLEAEGLVFKRQIVRLSAAAGLGVIMLLLFICGLAFLLFSLFRVLDGPLPTTAAISIVGAVAILLAWGALLYTRRMLR